MPSTAFNLALVYRPDLFSGGDYQAIAHEIRKKSGDIEVYILRDVAGIIAPPGMFERPLMTFCPTQLQHFKPARGAAFTGQRIAKDEQMKRLAKSGVRVPKWAYAEAGLKLSEAEWGSVVIVKPIAFGFASKGRGIELASTSAFTYVPPALSTYQGKRKSHYVVQQFIDTGEFSQDYRVVTLFGRPLYALYRKSLIPLMRPNGVTVTRTQDGVISNAPSGPRELHFCYDKEVLDFAATCYRAIPEVPLQAVDVRRDIHTGRLYCLEINPGGNTWNFSSPHARNIPTIDGIRREDQLGAWSIAAEALIENTRLFAG